MMKCPKCNSDKTVKMAKRQTKEFNTHKWNSHFTHLYQIGTKIVLAVFSKSLKNLQKKRANNGNRTHDLRFTKPLLYRLSYVGI